MAILIVGAIALSTYKALRRPLPKPQMVAASQLHLPGYKTEVSGINPPKGHADVSIGLTRRFKIYPPDGGAISRVILAPMRMREKFLLPGLRITEALHEQYPHAHQVLQLDARNEIAISHYGGTHSRKGGGITRLESCLTPSGSARFAPSGSLAPSLQKERNEEWSKAPLQTLLSRSLGSEINSRWECLAVLIEQPTHRDSQDELIKIWTLARDRITDSAH
jgi:hypothetical protein